MKVPVCVTCCTCRRSNELQNGRRRYSVIQWLRTHTHDVSPPYCNTLQMERWSCTAHVSPNTTFMSCIAGINISGSPMLPAYQLHYCPLGFPVCNASDVLMFLSTLFRPGSYHTAYSLHVSLHGAHVSTSYRGMTPHLPYARTLAYSEMAYIQETVEVVEANAVMVAHPLYPTKQCISRFEKVR